MSIVSDQQKPQKSYAGAQMTDIEDHRQPIVPIEKSTTDGQPDSRMRVRIEYEGPSSEHVHVEFGGARRSGRDEPTDWLTASRDFIRWLIC
jgi:hypothetical protein